jgi:hypothetical protein
VDAGAEGGSRVGLRKTGTVEQQRCDNDDPRYHGHCRSFYGKKPFAANETADTFQPQMDADKNRKEPLIRKT